MSTPLLHPGAVSSSGAPAAEGSSLNSRVRGAGFLPYDPPVHQPPHIGQLHHSPSVLMSLLVTITQLWALFRKNLWVLLRSPKSLVALLILPLLFIAIIWIVQSKINANNDVDNSGIDVPLTYQACETLDIYGNPDPSQPCVSVYFSPSTNADVVNVMQSLAARTGLVYGVDIVPVTDIFSLILTLAQKIGRFDSAITFDNYSGRECWSEPCQDVETEPEKIQAANLMKSLASYSQKFDEDLARSQDRMEAASCPLSLSTLNVTYTLWINATANYNDRVPGFVNTEQSWQGNTQGAILPARYWGLQHALNLAIADVMTGIGVPEVQKQVEEKKAARAYAKRQALTEARKQNKNAELHHLEQNDNTGGSPLYLTMFSFFSGRTGSSNSYNDNDDYSLDDYANDSVTKFAGSSIISIAVLVITLLNMQLLAYEKQAKLIGILRIMGMNEFSYWFSWLLSFALLSAGASLLATGMGKISELQIWQYCDFGIHFVAMFLYILSMCGLAMLFTSFIQRTIILNIIGFLLFFMTIISNIFFGSVFANYIYRPDLPNWLQIIYYVFPWFHYSKIWADALTNTSKITFNDNVKKITTHVQFRYTWSEITQTQRIYLDCPYGDEICCLTNDSEVKCFDAPSTASAMINLVILTSFYFFFSWYLAQVFGGSLGMNRRPWFLLTPEFWGFKNEQDEKLDQLATLHARSQGGAGGQNGSQELLRFMGQDRLTNEQYLSYRNQELRTYKLSKSYKKTSAVKEVTLKMQKDEVFVLLGANGAGKSSLVNCLTGLQEPTFGGGWMFGHAITNVSEIHRLAGVCMQDDILFEDLSARETLYVFAAVRGIPFSELRNTVNEKLKQFHMDSYADKAVRALSGGMKRRLSLSLSTLGDPSIVFLDEPTTGMDPVNRNKIWSTIKELKRNRIVVLTTHNMEEADYLGDTIALMSNGRMRAMGSALFLKNRYGAGYQLQLLVNPAFHQQIQTIIKQLLPGCEIIHSAGHNAVNADTVGTEREGAAAGNAGNNTSGHGNFTIGLKRKSLRQLPAFFQWMDAEEKRWKEHVARELASGQSNLAQAEQEKVLREWSLSNSTLEEVFLRLCAVEKNINERVAGSAEADDLAEAERAEAAESARLLRADEDFANANHDDEKCMLCHTRVALEKVTLYSKSGVAVDFAHLLCGECSHSPEAEQMVKGPASLLSSEGGEASTAVEDDAPIQLSEFADPHALAQFAPLLPAGGAAGPGRAAPAGVGAYNVHAAPKGVNNELDIANSEDQFHLAWDAMSKSPPTLLQQVRATYLKDFSKFRAEKKSFACKVIILAVMTFVIAYYTTTSNNQCPGGWVQAQKDWQQDMTTLPCNLLNISYMFAQYYQNPIVPFGGNYNPQSCCNNPGPLDTYECQYPGYANPGACGWVPTWTISLNNQNFQPWTQDVLVPNPNPTPGSAPRVRSETDVPFANWTKTATYNQITRSQWIFSFTDQTHPISYEIPATIPPGPPTYIPSAPLEDIVARANAYESKLPPSHFGSGANSIYDMVGEQREQAMAQQNWHRMSAGERKAMERRQAKQPTPRQPADDNPPLSPENQKLAEELISNLSRDELRSMINEIQVVNLGAPDSTISNINDLLWQNQLWVDKNATSIPSLCNTNSGQPPYAVVVYVNTMYVGNIVSQYYYSIFPSAGIEMVSAKPYPMANGVRINETSNLNFVPDMEYRMYYWEESQLPRSFYFVYNYTWGESWYLTCSNQYPQLLGSKDLSTLIHGMSHSYLQTRMQSLYTNRLDLGRNVTFTTYWDNLIPTPNSTASICPNPKINAQFVQFPNVNYSPSLGQMNIAIALGLLVFISLLNFPNTTSHIIYERESQLLHMMRISGMHDLAYWLGNYLFDFTVLIVWFAFVLIFGYAYGSIVFTGSNMGVLIFACLCFIHYSITFAWLVAAFFAKRRIVLVACYLLVVVASFLAVTMDQYLPTTWNPIYLWIPPGAWIKTLSTIIRYNPKTISDEHGAQLLSAILIMIAEGCIMFLVAMYWNILRYRHWAEVFLPASLRHCTQDNSDSSEDANAVELNQHSFAGAASEGLLSRQQEEEDMDVAAERVKVNQLAKGDPAAYPAILIHNLRKEFQGKATKKGKATPKKIAVDKLCLSVQYGECFGLLGPNGAGKSTTLSILTGLLDPTAGTAHLCGFNLLNSMQDIFTVLGICTQFDVVWEDLTVYDHLLFYARLKGVPRDWEKGLVQYIAELTELDGDPLMKPADSLSGGMKRRLSLGISLIGNPSIWLLDEPSTGLSPETRREIWNIIEKRKQRSRPRAGPNPSPGKAIVITTHMMEEADTLCDRIGIIAEGNLQCLGSSAHLKTRFGQGFKLTLHLSVEFERELVRDMIRNEVRAIGSGPASSGGAASNTSALNARALLVHEPGLADPVVNPNASPSPPPVAASSVAIGFVDPARQAAASQHLNLLKFITKMAPHARLVNIDGKHVEFRLVSEHANDASSSSSAAAVSSGVPSEGQTKEVLTVFNTMELHRHSLLPLFTILEWGLQQSSLEEVFMNIVHKYEAEEEH